MKCKLIVIMVLLSGSAKAQESEYEVSGCRPELRPFFAEDELGYRPILCEEFNKKNLDTGLWAYNYTWGDSSQIIGRTRVHNFSATMDESMVRVRNGRLTLRAKNEVHPTAQRMNPDGTPGIAEMPFKFCQQLKAGDRTQCQLFATTGAVTSRFKFQYGYLEARIRLPATHGMWPAFWMLHDGWPPEIDILEVLTNHKPDGTPTYFFSQNYHYHAQGNRSAYKAFNKNEMTQLGLCLEAEIDCGRQFSKWQVYGVKWIPGEISFYVNGRFSHSFKSSTAVTDVPGYIMLNLGVGGWAANPDQTTHWNRAKMDVDWLRIWEVPEAATRLILPASGL